MSDDPLLSIVVDESTRIDRARHILAAILNGYVEISQQTGEMSLLPPVYELPPKEQILIVLCARLAQKLLAKLPEGHDEKLSQSEVMEILPTLPSGTVKTCLWWLRDKRFIANIDKKNCVTPAHLSRVQGRLNELQKGGLL